MDDIALAVDRIYRKEAGRLHAYLLSKVGGDFQLAEDALHDAVAKAIENWKENGMGAVTFSCFRLFCVFELEFIDIFL